MMSLLGWGSRLCFPWTRIRDGCCNAENPWRHIFTVPGGPARLARHVHPGQNAESHPQAHRGVGGFRVTASSSIRNFHEAPPAATGPRSFPGDSCAAGRAGPVPSSSNPTGVREAMSTPRSLPAQPVVAIVGATGAVGIDLIRCLEQRRFPLGNLRLMASARSAGRTLEFKGRPLPVEELT